MGKFFDTVSSPKQFSLIKSKGKYFRTEYGYGFILNTDLKKSVLSVIVSKKVSKLAVVRNRIKRLFRAAFTDILRKSKDKSVGLVYVFKGHKSPHYKEVWDTLTRIIN
ncbi:ribonuclease P protein component [Candidatus Dojkabacteria bacterium]|nr:ribonuclease P protein component [Candidatus Dojkabacteria bacterium]